MFMCPTITKQHMMTSLKTRQSQTCFFMSHILIKGKAIRYGQLNAKRKQVTDMWHVIHLYSIQINNYFTGILEDLNMVQQSRVTQIYCEPMHRLGNHTIFFNVLHIFQSLFQVKGTLKKIGSILYGIFFNNKSLMMCSKGRCQAPFVSQL